jgi:hypothetical protein
MKRVWGPLTDFVCKTANPFAVLTEKEMLNFIS